MVAAESCSKLSTLGAKSYVINELHVGIEMCWESLKQAMEGVHTKVIDLDLKPEGFCFVFAPIC